MGPPWAAAEAEAPGFSIVAGTGDDRGRSGMQEARQRGLGFERHGAVDHPLQPAAHGLF